MSSVPWRSARFAAALLLGAAHAASAAVTVDIGAASAPRSGWARVPISISGAPSGAGGVQVDVQFPTAVLSVADPATACTMAPGVAGNVASGLVGGAPAGKARLRVIVLDFGGGVFTGPLATCTFRVAGNAALGTYALQGVAPGVADPFGDPLAAVVDHGSVTVTPCTGCCP